MAAREAREATLQAAHRRAFDFFSADPVDEPRVFRRHLISPHCFSVFQESFSERHPSPVSVPHPCGQCDRREITPSVDKESGLWGDERTNAGPCEKSNLSMLSKTDTSAHTSKKGKFAHTSFPIGKGDRAQYVAVQCSPAHLSAVQGSQ